MSCGRMLKRNSKGARLSTLMKPRNLNQSTNAQGEKEELCTCHFPDGTTSEVDGGFNEVEAFKKFAADLQSVNFNVELKANLQKEFVKDNDSDQLVGSSCLLQFPCGAGGIDERRQRPKGDHTESLNVEEFFAHLSKRSDPVMQTPLPQLMMHSVISRSRLLRVSRPQVKRVKDMTELANGINSEDVTSTIQTRQRGDRHSGMKASKKPLQSVEAGSCALPHTNQKARTIRESTQHHFGMGSVFATVTLDDKNNFLVQVIPGEEVDDGRDISQLTLGTCVTRMGMNTKRADLLTANTAATNGLTRS